MAKRLGTNNPDCLVGTFQDDEIDGLGGDDFIALLQCVDHVFLFLRTFHLRTNQHEIEQDENNNEGQELHHAACGV